MLVGLDPPGKRSAARHPEFEIMYRPLVQTLVPDDKFMKLYPVRIPPERLIEIGERHLSALAVDPGGKKGEIIEKPEEKSEGDE